MAGGHGPGGASYQLGRPVSTTIDDAGAMYVCEVGASRVSKWNASASCLDVESLTAYGGTEI